MLDKNKSLTQFLTLVAPLATHVVPGAAVLALPVINAQASGGALDPVITAVALLGGVILMVDGLMKFKDVFESLPSEAV